MRLLFVIGTAALLAVQGGCRDPRSPDPAVALAGTQPSAAAQSKWAEERDSVGSHQLSTSDACTSCLHLQKVVVLGAARGDEDVLITYPFEVLQDRAGRFWVPQKNELKVFDAQGKYMDDVGRPGNGPLEWVMPVPVHADGDGHVHIVDKGNGRVSVVGSNLKLVRESPFPFTDFREAVGLGSDSYVVSAWGGYVAEVGQPLHVVQGGKVSQSFGTPHGGDPITRFTARRMLAADGEGRVYSMPYYDFIVEAWAPDGRRITGVTGARLNESPVLLKPYNLEDNPLPSEIVGLQVDPAGHLWIASWHLSPDWKGVFDPVVYPDGYKGLKLKPGKSTDSVMRTRIDVIDLNERRIIASTEHPGRLRGWVGPGVLYQNREGPDGSPQVDIWAVRLMPRGNP